MSTHRWQAGNPPEHGYYIAAWEDGDRTMVSELWYNPSTNYWSHSRGYFQEHQQQYGSMPVVAWMPMPAYPGPPEPDPSTVDHTAKSDVYRVHIPAKVRPVIMSRVRMMANRFHAVKIEVAQVKETEWKDITGTV